jgi:hypothetical protein
MLAELKARHPQLYSDCRWISCGTGWRDIIERASADLNALARRENVAVQIEHIREKYGVLRIWVTATSAAVDAAAEEIANSAETESESTCELCGSAGTLREENRVLKVRCPKCERVR